MKTKKLILICPKERRAVAALAVRQPLVLAPFAGETVLEYALQYLAVAGYQEILIQASDRADAVRHMTGRGEKWGLSIQVESVAAEPPAEDVRAKLAALGDQATEVLVLEHLPQGPVRPLWESYESWFAAQLGLLGGLKEPQVGVREVAPGVFVGLRSQVADGARLIGPCWIGSRVRIGRNATVGPEVVVMEESLVDEGAEVAQSLVGPRTYVGAHTELRNAFAHGALLVNLRNGSSTMITDKFLLGDLEGLSKIERPGIPDGNPAMPARQGSRFLRWMTKSWQRFRGEKMPDTKPAATGKK